LRKKGRPTDGKGRGKKRNFLNEKKGEFPKK